ncbi:hypothetical protein RCL1_002834 [Eukaryota sp. TZLM3-RCL]
MSLELPQFDASSFSGLLSINSDELTARLQAFERYTSDLHSKCLVEGIDTSKVPVIKAESILSNHSNFLSSLQNSSFSLSSSDLLHHFSSFSAPDFYQTPTPYQILENATQFLAAEKELVTGYLNLLNHRLALISRSNFISLTEKIKLEHFCTEAVKYYAKILSEISDYSQCLNFSTPCVDSLIISLKFIATGKMKKCRENGLFYFLKPAIQRCLFIDEISIPLKSVQLLTKVKQQVGSTSNNWSDHFKILKEKFGFSNFSSDQTYFECEKLVTKFLKFQMSFLHPVNDGSESSDFMLIDSQKIDDKFFNQKIPILIGVPDSFISFSQAHYYRSKSIKNDRFSTAVDAEIKSLSCIDPNVLLSRFRRTTLKPTHSKLSILSSSSFQQDSELLATSLDHSNGTNTVIDERNRQLFSYLTLRHLTINSTRIKILSLLNLFCFISRHVQHLSMSSAPFPFSLSSLSLNEIIDLFKNFSEGQVDDDVINELCHVGFAVTEVENNRRVVFDEAVIGLVNVEKRISRTCSQQLLLNPDEIDEFSFLYAIGDAYNAEHVFLNSCFKVVSVWYLFALNSPPNQSNLIASLIVQHVTAIISENSNLSVSLNSLEMYTLAIYSNEYLASSFALPIATWQNHVNFDLEHVINQSVCIIPDSLIPTFEGVDSNIFNTCMNQFFSPELVSSLTSMVFWISSLLSSFFLSHRPTTLSSASALHGSATQCIFNNISITCTEFLTLSSIPNLPLILSDLVSPSFSLSSFSSELDLSLNDPSLDALDVSVLDPTNTSIPTDSNSKGNIVRFLLNTCSYFNCLTVFIPAWLTNRSLIEAHHFQLTVAGRVVSLDSLELQPLDSNSFSYHNEPSEAEDLSFMLDLQLELSKKKSDFYPIASGEVSKSLEPSFMSGSFSKALSASRLKVLTQSCVLEQAREFALRGIILQNKPLIEHLIHQITSSDCNQESNSTFITTVTKKDRLVLLAQISPFLISFLNIRVEIRRSLRAWLLRFQGGNSNLLIDELVDLFVKNLTAESKTFYLRSALISTTQLCFDSGGIIWRKIKSEFSQDSAVIEDLSGFKISNPFIIPTIFEILKISRDDAPNTAFDRLLSLLSCICSIQSISENYVLFSFIENSHVSSFHEFLENFEQYFMPLQRFIVQIIQKIVLNYSNEGLVLALQEQEQLTASLSISLIDALGRATLKRQRSTVAQNFVLKLQNYLYQSLNTKFQNLSTNPICPLNSPIFFFIGKKWIILDLLASLKGSEKVLASAEFTGITLKSLEFSSIKEELSSRRKIEQLYIAKQKIGEILEKRGEFSPTDSKIFTLDQSLFENFDAVDIASRAYLLKTLIDTKISVSNFVTKYLRKSTSSNLPFSFAINDFQSSFLDQSKFLTYQDFSQFDQSYSSTKISTLKNELDPRDPDDTLHVISRSKLKKMIDLLIDNLNSWKSEEVGALHSLLDLKSKESQKTQDFLSDSLLQIKKSFDSATSSSMSVASSFLTYKSYQLLLDNDLLRTRVFNLEERLKNQKEELKVKIRQDFQKQLNDLQKQCVLTEEKLKAERVDSQNRINQSLIEAKANALKQLAETSTSLSNDKLKSHLLKSSSDSQRISDLQTRVDELESTLAQYKVFSRIFKISHHSKLENEVESLKFQLSATQNELYSLKEKSLVREEVLRNRVADLQKSLSSSKSEVDEMTRLARQAEDLKEKFLRQRIVAMRRVKELEDLKDKSKGVDQAQVAVLQAELSSLRQQTKVQYCHTVTPNITKLEKEVERLHKELEKERVAKYNLMERIEENRQKALVSDRNHVDCVPRSQLQNVLNENQILREALSNLDHTTMSASRLSNHGRSSSIGYTQSHLPTPSSVHYTGKKTRPSRPSSAALQSPIPFSVDSRGFSFK